MEILLPRAEEDAATPESGLHQRPKSGRETILVADDEEVVRAVVKEILVREGYVVLEARNGREAVELCRNHDGTIHLVVTDLLMPEMGGRELVEHLAVLCPDVRVLYASSYPEAAAGRDGMIVAGAAYIQKPVTRAALLRKVREVLDGEHAAATAEQNIRT